MAAGRSLRLSRVLRPTRIGGLAAIVLIAGAVAAPAQAYKVSGKRWPGHTITVRNQTGLKFAVPEAMRRWNAVGLPVKFKATTSRRANLVIRAHHRNGPKGACAGYATVGYTRFYQSQMDLLATCADDLLTASVVVHELGHVLGLGHESRQCAVMNPTLENGAPNHCDVESVFTSGIFRCRVIEPDDIAGVRKLYKGAPKVPATTNCPAFGPPAPAASVTAAYQANTWPQFATVAVPPSPTPLLRIEGLQAPQPELLVSATLDSCAAAPPAAPASPNDKWWVMWGQTTTVPIGSQFTPGRWCVSVWVANALGTSAPATAWLDVPAQTDPPPAF